MIMDLDKLLNEALRMSWSYRPYYAKNKIKQAFYEWTEDGLAFKFVVPGIESKDIKVRTEDNKLKITIEDECRSVDVLPYFECPNMRKIERRASEVKLSLGILTVLFPYVKQTEEEQPKEYEIKID